MSGYFKLVDAHDHGYRLKLMADDGTLIAVSAYFPTKQSAVEGIDAIREIAGTGPVMDHTRKDHSHREQARPDQTHQQGPKRRISA
ncbi:YegP family protein [Arthrobacter subterraneus]|uniref:YegP family protein n=1 Tax=Arthrobacter subterraneus TaxID=335973 RepID=UPI0037FBC1CE